MKTDWKRGIRRWGVMGHTWVGLFAGALFLVMSLSGTILAFKPQIESAYEPARTATVCAHVPDPDGLLRATRSLSTGSNVQRITVSPSCPGLLLVQIGGQNQSTSKLFYDSSSGKFVGSADVRWLEWVSNLHQNLLATNAGRHFVGFVGVALLISILSGGLIWLVSHPQPKHLLPWRGRSSFRRYIFDFHRATGLIAVPLLLVQALTGVELAFPQTAQSLFLPSGSRSPKAKKVSSKGKPAHHRSKGVLIQPDLSWALLVAAQAMPEGTLREVRFPSQPGQGLEFRF
ncbi:MAG TPA: PepSY-associated TM helix domain-containing protein [Bryobacteraceae bacterium]|nr:PepSY-associated TM helix domain-containing protein [Bryobacteraceae bacterium]